MRIKYDKRASGYEYVLKRPEGTVGRDLHRRANRVQNAARLQVGVRTGALKMSITTNHIRTARGQAVEVGSSLPYALMHHEGTRPRVIHGRNGGVLRFTSQSRVVYSRTVKHPGTRPNRYLTDNLWLATN